jgi:hypothetical protein
VGKGGSMIERDEFYGFTTIRATNRYQPYAERPPFLVDGILHRTMTLIYGEKGCGKSTLAASMATALANGEPAFLNRKVNAAKPLSVGVIAGDFDDDNSYAEQFRQTLDDGVEISVYGLDRPPSRKVWEGLQLAARHNSHDVVIVDNLTSFIDGSLNDDISVNEFYDRMDAFVRDGRAVVVVAHSTEKTGVYGKSRYPMGSSAIRARARWIWFVQATRAGTRITFSGNYDAPHEITVSAPNGIPRFRVLSAATADELQKRQAGRQRERDKATLDRNARIARIIRDNPGMPQRDLAKLAGVSQSTVSRVRGMDIAA